jgi:DNA-binding SARP family transcriptional activator/tetratricopeptide (TPR) repeat protein
MRFALLGPLTVTREAGVQVSVGGARLRVLLAVLLLHANEPVSLDALFEAVWDGTPPPGAPEALRGHVVRLRRVLGPEDGARIAACNPGYLIRVADSELDVRDFQALCKRGGAAIRGQAWTEASSAVAEALNLWRGAPLADVPYQTLRDAWVPHLERTRMQALEWRIEAHLHLGHHEHVVLELADLTGRHPLRERFHAQLMLALARCGRQAEALEAYQRARRILVDELGIEPGPELRALHERILSGQGEPAVTVPSGAAVGMAPRQLPAAPRHFTGRQTELERLIALARGDGGHAGTVVISAIDGMAGIGKTALAVHAAHRLAGDYPDGQLFLDLHGYTQGHLPRSAGEALDWLLRALGAPAGVIPKDDEQAAAFYRQRLAGTRTLIVLDNAATEAQIRPLLPGAGSCLVLITSRRRLKALDDAHTLSLDLLPRSEAVALLRAAAGPDRVRADDPLLDEVAGLCGYLPLVLRIAAALLRHRPAWNLEHLYGLLREQHRRIPALSDGDRDLGTVFDLSYQSLTAGLRRAFRRLGLVPGPDLDAYAAAALTGTDPATAAGLLEDLVDHNLLIAYAPGRYRQHDLLRAHARTWAAADPGHGSALERLLSYYAHTAQSASITIARYPRPEPDGPAPAHAPSLTSPEAARAWLRTERDNLEAAHAFARTLGWHGHALALIAGLAEILRTDGPFMHALELHQAATETAERLGRPALRAAALTELGILWRLTGNLTAARDTLAQAVEIHRATGQRQGEATTLAELGIVQQHIGDLAGAADTHNRALEIYRAAGHRQGEADALTDLGMVRRLTGDLAGAADTYLRALEIHRTTGQRSGEAYALTELATVRRLTGDLTAAGDALSQALEIYRATSYRRGEAYALTGLGIVRRLTGELDTATEALAQALEIHRTLGNRSGEAYALTELATVRRLTGDLDTATDALAQALEIHRATGSRNGESWALNHYAAAVAAGDRQRARALYQQALAMNRELNKPDDQAIALEGLGECHLADGGTDAAATHLHQALEIFQRLGMALDARRVQDRLHNLAT